MPTSALRENFEVMEDAVNTQRIIIFFLYKEDVKTSGVVQRLQGLF